MSNRMKRAIEAWGEVPDWLIAVIEACDQDDMSQSKVASRMGYSGSVLSQVIVNDYRGDMQKVERHAREVFLQGKIPCPHLGEIQASACIAWKRRATTLSSNTPQVVRMFRVCRQCPRYLNEDAENV